MRAEQENSDHASWMEVVRSATSWKDAHLNDQSSACPYMLEPFWILDVHQEEADDDTNQTGGMLKRLSRSSNAEIIRSYVEEEQKLVSELRSKLDMPATFTREAFFLSLKPFLKNTAKNENRMSSPKENRVNHSSKTDLVANNVISEEYHAVLVMLRQTAFLLGQGVVATILECCVTLGLWNFVELLLEKGVVSANRCALLIDKLIESKQAWLLCLSIKYIPDLQPPDLLQMLRFLLGNLQNGKGLFDSVREHWKKKALSAIRLASKHKKSPENSKDTDMDLGSVHHSNTPSKKKSSRHLIEALRLAAAVDGFQPAELCLHGLIVSGQDDAVLSTVISQLDAAEALQLLHYLNKWIDKYLKHLEQLPFVKTRKAHQVPTLSQVAQWVSLLLDVHYTTIVLSSSFRDQLTATADMVGSLIAIEVKFSSLIGLTEHLTSKAALPTEKPGSIGADHIIEFVQMN
ncbi:hypothetical protein O6H91_04G093000 [Diphasiastrum complanatum]|uniref:Uncharacterized protein n=3 Tax=Diphasiastrum complanatum TaxID=34168 RepID=A0ACC2DZS4_DIPCM|nr:hypothetical protein O6H91_04G093000 [Diphasiastrum complanatum]KAJ7559609.1 hypothetical protein O6H91_04G093000 [Diphasiastrum complanatum]KAJ7559610.1 hypothetical protein O6H91_04G093000 [Diphasiastrum complanatum]